MEGESEVLEPFELHHSDLLLLSSPSSSPSGPGEIERLESVSRAAMKALGPSGPGLLAITGAERASELRRSLLSLSRRLALLDNDDRRRVLKLFTLPFLLKLLEKHQDHGLGTDVSLKNPDRSVSSFVLHLSYQYREFKKLGSNFKDLGICMMRLGLQLAQVCDKAIGGQVLEKSILDSGSAKGRLIHYHSALDTTVLRARGNKKESTLEENSCSCMLCVQEYSPPGGHTYLQLFDANTDKILVVKTPPESFIVQVGESADILSKGKLRSTLHSVYKPMGLENVSRDIFVLFLQPAWNKTFSISDYPPTASTESSESHRLGQEIHRMIPPLFSRLRDGMTFAEFSRETTKQYYGGSGTQSIR
ncbi:hypothetical protein QJS04_geneDACA007513 [Acorus gramineus]|uniref:Isopenicillin N synthase-like Fe(2+) 2OG dioxygenase domain-containing protein n=1 Tax=Acorus gramineus TaxID=55184 RepID=A0AAV9B583_ACOGR|nr:hypothetical protein QJS04_geneDACA007513 [Acorus gramineus]